MNFFFLQNEKKCFPGTKVKSVLWQIIVTFDFFHVFILNHNLCVVIKDKTKERYTTYQQKRTKKCFFVMASQNPMVFCIFSDKIRYLTMTDSTKVWMPDTFFRNEKIGRFHNILQPNLYVRVFPNGDVLYSIRVSLTCACSMHLALFPLDMQTCNLDVTSCVYTYLICINLRCV